MANSNNRKGHRATIDRRPVSFNDRKVWMDLLAIVCFGLALRTLLLVAFPVPYGNDGFGRIYFKDSIFLAHWLPLTQVIVFTVASFSTGIFPIRFTFALLGALAACGFYLFLRLLVRPSMALFGGLLFSVNALYVILSLMPYQDVLFLGLFYASLAFLFERTPVLRSGRGAFFYGLASLTRYESWFVMPWLIFWKARLEADDASIAGRSRSLLKSGLALGSAPPLWFLLSQLRWGEWNSFLVQTPDQRFYGWHPHFDLLWSLDYAARMLYWMGLFGSPLLLFALLAPIALARSGARLHAGLKVILVLSLLLLAFFFFVIGRQQETVFRFVMFPLSAVLVLAVMGIETTLDWISRKRFLGPFPTRWRRCLAGLILATLALYATLPVARLNARPEFLDPYLIAQYLDEALKGEETALVVADRSRQLLDAAPVAYQRIVAQSRAGADRILSSGLLEETDPGALLEFAQQKKVRYLVIFENFEPWLPADVFYSGLVRSSPQGLAVALDTKTATVYQISSWPRP
ncbi:MAG: hypothetical protein ACE5JX_09455 [Acidobacteriota bacterium]